MLFCLLLYGTAFIASGCLVFPLMYIVYNVIKMKKINENFLGEHALRPSRAAMFSTSANNFASQMENVMSDPGLHFNSMNVEDNCRLYKGKDSALRLPTSLVSQYSMRCCDLHA